MKHREQPFVREPYDARINAQSIADIERTLLDMDALVTALDQFVMVEEVRTRIRDMNHCAYSTAARAARIRSDNLKKSFVALRVKLLELAAEHQGSRPALAIRDESGQASVPSGIRTGGVAKSPPNGAPQPISTMR
jgi:hypothetical protein